MVFPWGPFNHIQILQTRIFSDIGSIYVRKLHFIGKKIKNIANIRIWFGARKWVWQRRRKLFHLVLKLLATICFYNNVLYFCQKAFN